MYIGYLLSYNNREIHMTNTPLSAVPVRKSWLFFLSTVLVVLLTGVSIVTTFWDHNRILFGERARPAMLFVQTHSLGVAIALEIWSSFFFLLILWHLHQRTASRFHKRLDSERMALMELATHQLGAPLASLRWWLEMLKDPGVSEKDKAEMFQEIETALLRMDTIVSSLTHAQNIDLKELSSQFDHLSTLRFLVYDAVYDFSNDVKMKELKIVVEIDPQMPPLKVDPVQVGDVLRELIENAIGFSPAKSVLTVIVTTDRSKKVVQVEVRDQGIGIPAAEQSRIFEKMFRASNASSVKPVGNGLGLHNVKAMIEEQGGEMWVKSREGRGTSVFFTLPFEKNA